MFPKASRRPQRLAPLNFARQRIFSAALLVGTALLLSACASTPVPAAPPKLVVLLVVDGLPQRQITAYRDQLAPDGLARFLDRGTWFADARYGHAFTVTAAGHATLLTGAYPHRSGIIGNSWRDPASGAPVYNTGDTGFTYIGHPTDALDGTSPRNLKAETVGDVLRRADPRSKVLAISGKDRGAILPAGQSGTAYMYMGGSGEFASSTYYMKAHPAWAAAFNAGKPADRYFLTEWTQLLPDAAYARSLPDNQSWYPPRGNRLPVMMGAPGDLAPTPSFYSGLLRSPFADALALDFARAAIAGEQLGQDSTPDILSISLSGHDYVNHAFSAESRLSHDHLLQLDRLLQAFFRDLDSSIGRGNYLAVLTADHGFMPAPEYSAAQGLPSGRINGGELLARINAGLQARFGPGRLASFSGSSLLLDKTLMAAQKADVNAVTEEARKLLLAEPAIAAAYTRRELETGSRAGDPLFAALEKSWHRDVSGDIQYAVQPNWMFSSGTTGATHGSPYDYDNHVPLLMYGPRWMKPGRIDSRVHMSDLAPTLSDILGIAAPSLAEGRVLPLQAP